MPAPRSEGEAPVLLDIPRCLEALLPLPFHATGERVAVCPDLLVFGWHRILETRSPLAFETQADECGAAALDLRDFRSILSRQLPVRLPVQKTDERGARRFFQLVIPDWGGRVVFHLADPCSMPGSFGTRNVSMAEVERLQPRGVRS